MIQTPKEISGEVKRYLRDKAQRVKIKGDVMQVDIGAKSLYDIPLSEIASEREILKWAVQICGKRTSDKLTVETFIEKALTHLDKSKR